MTEATGGIGVKRYRSPMKVKLPITPPSSVKKKQTEACDSGPSVSEEVTPKELLPALRKARAPVRRKPRLTYRPATNSVFQLAHYVSDPELVSARDADFIRYALQHSRDIVVVTGAGISVAAGIPDFRSSDGLFATLRGGKVKSGKHLFDFNHVYSSDDMSMQFNRMIVDIHGKSQRFEPTEFHRLLDGLAQQGRVRRIYTQNIDCLENKLANISSLQTGPKQVPKTIQLHGSINHMCCNKCRKIYDMDPTLFKCGDNDTTGDVIPVCPECEELEAVRRIAGKREQGVGKLRPYIVLYNEVHPEGEKVGEIVAKDLRLKCDCLIIVGTSLQIPGVKTICRQFCQAVRARKGIVLWVNKELPTQAIQDFLGGMDLIIVGDCQDLTTLAPSFN